MRSGRMAKATRGFSLFTNWFNGLCAPLCGLWMDPGALGMLLAGAGIVAYRSVPQT